MDIQIQGDTKVLRMLENAGVSTTNFSDELNEVGAYLLDFVQRIVFETEGGIYGQRWAGLSDKYSAYKKNVYRGRGILERTGIMRSSFRFETRATELIFDNPVEYLKYHQFGTSKMPQRTIYKLDDERKRAIVDIFQQGLQQKLNQANA